MTSTEVAVVNAAELAALAGAAGADPTANSGPRVPQLKVNMEDEDADGTTLPRGSFFVTDQDVTVYAKNVRFRPLTHHLQYTHYDGKENKMVSRTLQNTSFQQEFRDTNGTIRCGRPGGQEWKNMPEEAKKKYEDITCSRLVRGIVSYEGETKDGEKVTVENVPCVLRLKGSNFMPFEEQYMKALPNGRMVWDYWIDLSPKREKNGSVVYYIIQFAADFSAPAPVDVPTFETIKHFTAMVEADNAKVEEAYKKALARKNGDADVYDSIDYGDSNLDADFEDAA
jgi:hypothetical protein